MTDLNRILVDAVGEAFNANDIDAVMSFFDENAVFDHAAGPEPHGLRFEGKGVIRGVFAGLFEIDGWVDPGYARKSTAVMQKANPYKKLVPFYVEEQAELSGGGRAVDRVQTF